jgi:hypothetical protein
MNISDDEWVANVERELVKQAHPDPRDAVIAELVGALQDVVDELYTPEQNCSCHISPPCSDCLEYDGLRRIISNSHAALAKAEALK